MTSLQLKKSNLKIQPHSIYRVTIILPLPEREERVEYLVWPNQGLYTEYLVVCLRVNISN